MPIELMQVVTPDDEAVDLWLDVDAALAIGLEQGNDNNAIYDVLAGLKLEDEDDVDPDTMTTVRLTLDTENLELYLQPGALEELEAAAQAELVGESTLEAPPVAEEAPVEEEADLASYIQEMAAWFPSAFDGWVYNLGDQNQALTRQVTVGDVTGISNQQDNPPSWDGQALLRAQDTGAELGVHLVTFMVQDEVPYAYLDADTFAEVNAVMLAVPADEEEGADLGEDEEGDEGDEPVAEGALPEKAEVAKLLQTANGSDDTRQELFYRVGDSSAIDDYDIYLLEPDSIVGKIGDELSGEHGWWISPKLQVVPPEDEGEPLVVEITAAKLLVTADNKTVWIEVPADEI